MTESSATQDGTRRDPWPSPQQAWQDPPWLMTGRSLTAWFDVPWSFMRRSMSPDLLPPEAARARIRLRFYDLAFRSLGVRQAGSLAPREGRFREAVVGLPAVAQGTAGEVSIFMWADAEPYLTWGREVFGWPLLRGQLDLLGPIWDRTPDVDAVGSCLLQSAAGSARLDDIHLTAKTGTGSPSGLWLTPRRTLLAAGLAGETRDVLVVRPDVRRAGVRFAGRCRVTFEFDEPHPLAELGTLDADLDVADGFELVVGGDASVL